MQHKSKSDPISFDAVQYQDSRVREEGLRMAWGRCHCPNILKHSCSILFWLQFASTLRKSPFLTATDKEIEGAKVLSVQDQAPSDLNTRIRIGRLFLLAGSPVRAADVFRGILPRKSGGPGTFRTPAEAHL